MDMPQPTPGHKKLERLVGTWVGDEHMEPSQWCATPTAAKGRSETRLAVNGFAVVTDYQQTKDGEVMFTGHGVYTYDAAEDLYLLHWFDCMGCGVEIFTGQFEGDELVMSSKGPMGHMRLTGDYAKPGKLHSRMETSQDGKTWTLMFRGEYLRT